METVELGREIRVRDLEDPIGPPEVAEVMLAEVDERELSDSSSRTSSSVARAEAFATTART